MPKVFQLIPTDCGTLNNIRSNHGSWTWFRQCGYIQYFGPGYKPRIYEHRLVAEQAFGVKLDRTLHVHHINGDRSDNRVCNLQVLTRYEHAKIHNGDTHRMIICEHCGKEIKRREYHIKRRKHHFCNEECRGLAQRKVERPSADELKHLISTINNFLELGRMFGVSDNAVRAWARSYGILPPRRSRAKIKE